MFPFFAQFKFLCILTSQWVIFKLFADQNLIVFISTSFLFKIKKNKENEWMNEWIVYFLLSTVYFYNEKETCQQTHFTGSSIMMNACQLQLQLQVTVLMYSYDRGDSAHNRLARLCLCVGMPNSYIWFIPSYVSKLKFIFLSYS